MKKKLMSIDGYTEENVFIEARKLVDSLNRFGNCLGPSICFDGSDTYLRDRLHWLVTLASEKFGFTLDDIQKGIDSL